MPNWKKVIVSGSDAILNSVTSSTAQVTGIVNAGTDTDKFLVLDSDNNVDFRTGAQVLSDIGAGTGTGDVSSTGTPADNQIAVWTNSSTIEGDSNLTWDGSVLNAGGLLYINGGQVWDETTQGTSRGTLHIDPDGTTTDLGGAITFGSSDNASGISASAGIYTRTDGAYGSKMYFATTNNYSVGAQTAMMISHQGRVGIGTNDPDDPLHIYKNDTSANAMITLEQDGTGDASLDFVITGANLFRIGMDNSNNDAFTFSRGAFGGTLDIMTMRGYDVGIGNSVPSYKLDVSGSGNFTDSLDVTGSISVVGDASNTLLTLENSNGVVVDLNSSAGDSTIRFLDAGVAQWRVGRDNTQQNFVFSTGSGLGNGNVMTLTTTGNVGIGTTTPTEKLQVEGNISSSGDINTDGNIYLNQDNGHVYFSNTNVFVGENSNTNKLELRGGGSTTSQTVYIDNTGQMGIGTNVPSAKLDVRGNADISGSLSLSATGAELQVGTSQKGYIGVGTQADYSGNFTSEPGIGINTVHLVGDGSNRLKVRNSANNAYATTITNNYSVVNGGGLTTSNNRQFLTLNETTGNTAAVGAIGTSTDGDYALKVFSTENNAPLLVGSGSNNYMIVSSSGNVGIGTTTPTEKLTVEGTVSASNLALDSIVNAGTDTDKFLVLDSSGNVDFRTGAEVLSDIGAGTGTGDITRVNITAGNGLSGTSVDTTSGDHTQTLTVGAGTGIQVNSGDVAIDYTGTDNFIDSATNLEGTGIATGDTVVYHDATDNNVKKGFVSDLPFNNYSHPNHTGDVTSAGDGATTIANEAVTNAKLAHMAANTVKVRNANSTGDPSDFALANTEILIGDGSGFQAASLSGDATMTNTGVVTLKATGSAAGVQGSTANGTKIDTITIDPYGRVLAVATGATGDITGVTLTADSGTASDTAGNVDITIAGINGISTSATGTTLTVSGSNASTTAKGVVELATTAEVTTGTDTTRAVTPDALNDGYQGTANIDTLGTITSGDVSAILPAGLVSGSSQIDHDQTANFNANEHFTQANITTVGTVTSGDVSAILPAGTVSGSSQIDHDQTTNFNANEHFTQANITTVGTVTSGDVSAILPAGTVSGSSQISDASTTVKGIVELATTGETTTGTDTTRAVTPKGLADQGYLTNAGNLSTGSGTTLSIGQLLFADASLNASGSQEVTFNSGVFKIDTGASGGISASAVEVGRNILAKESITASLGIQLNNYNFPSADGTPGQAITTDGSGNLSFSTVSTGGTTIFNDLNNRVTTGLGTGDLNAEANLTFDGSKLSVGKTTATSPLHVYQNDSETGTATGITVEQDGTGDAVVQYLLTGGQRWVTGVDNSDSDKFKIASTSGLGSNSRFTIDVNGQVGINTSTPDTGLDVNGSISSSANLVVAETGSIGRLIVNGGNALIRRPSNPVLNITGTAGDATLNLNAGTSGQGRINTNGPYDLAMGVNGFDYLVLSGSAKILTLSSIGNNSTTFRMEQNAVGGTRLEMSPNTGPAYIETDNTNNLALGVNSTTYLSIIGTTGHVSASTAVTGSDFYIPNDIGSVSSSIAALQVADVANSSTLILSNTSGRYYTTSANSSTSYTTSSAVVGGFAYVKVNAASQPTVSGCKLISGSTFLASTDMTMVVYEDGDGGRFYFLDR